MLDDDGDAHPTPESDALSPSPRPPYPQAVFSLADDVRVTCTKVRFYDLEIVSEKPGTVPDCEHLVVFRYKCRVIGQKRFNELAEEKYSKLRTFRKADAGRWLFLDAVTGDAGE